MNTVYKFMHSPVGELTLVARDHRLAAILWENDNPTRVKLGPMTANDAEPVLLKAEIQLHEYFSGRRSRFELEFDFAGTDFQKGVWRALLSIPFGETRSYRDIAIQLGNPKATRAVGAAIGKNPISIITPCHRVIGTSGSLTGFAGGLATKAHLLQLESKVAVERAGWK